MKNAPKGYLIDGLFEERNMPFFCSIPCITIYIRIRRILIFTKYKKDTNIGVFFLNMFKCNMHFC